MANQRTTFLKRQREQNRNDKARAKEARLAARRAEARSARASGAAAEQVGVSADDAPEGTVAPVTPDVPRK
jgi:hypothetical protein